MAPAPAPEGDKPEGGKPGGEKPSESTPPAVDEYTAPTPFVDAPASMSFEQFEKMVRAQPAVIVNFYAPWCFWSKKLAPSWGAVAKRLHARSYSQSISMIKIDCTQPPGREICEKQVCER